MKKAAEYFLLMALAFISVSCKGTLDPDGSFIASQDVQLSVKSETIMKYDPLTWQLGYNSTDNEFRAVNDEATSYFYVGMLAVPQSVGQEIEAIVTWSSSRSSSSIKGTFKVVKTQGDMFWLWCGKKGKQVAVTVRVLR